MVFINHNGGRKMTPNFFSTAPHQTPGPPAARIARQGVKLSDPRDGCAVVKTFRAR